MVFACRDEKSFKPFLSDDYQKPVILRADNYFTVKYWAVGSKGKTGFQPCEELKGKKVGIEYLSVTGQDYSGLIQTVEISGD